MQCPKMEYVKREDAVEPLYPAVSEGMSHTMAYQSQQIPLNLVEQIQLAVQNVSLPEAQILPSISKNLGHLSRVELRELSVSFEQEQRACERIPVVLEEHRSDPATLHVQNRGLIQGLALPDGQRIVPLPFQIKAEQDAEENVYFYDHMMQQNYSSNGTIPLDHAVNIASHPQNENPPVHYIFNSHNHAAGVNVHTLHPTDAYSRQQTFFQYTTESREADAENLVVHRQYENVNYNTPEEMKRERGELLEKLHHTIRENHPNENIKPAENKIYYADYNPSDYNKCEIQNDSGVGSKPCNPDDVMYKTLIEAEYANIKGEYACFNCNGIFPSKRGLKQHLKSCAEETGEPAEKIGKFACNQCPYKCQSPAILKIHERTHTGEKPFSCNFCDYKSGQKNNVAKHTLVHMKEKPFHCQYCDYRCAQKNNLVVHERTHTGFKPFACTLCDYKTVQKPNLVKHMYLHTGQKPFSCDLCSYKCVQKTNLTKHKQRHLHEKGDKVESGGRSVSRPYRPRQKTFKCDLCAFKSVQKSGLDKHVQFKHGAQGNVEPEVVPGQFAEQGKCYEAQEFRTAPSSQSDHEQYKQTEVKSAQVPDGIPVPKKCYDETQGMNLMKHDVDGALVRNLSLRKSVMYSEVGLRQDVVVVPGQLAEECVPTS